jgi:glyoxylase-like metal-dependent hydrolase (beta-lactamase superfamily II)
MPVVHSIPLAYNSVYLIETEDARMLVDTGPDYDGAKSLLTEAMPAIPDLVVATHGHLDHAGLGAWWQKRGIPIALHVRDAHFPAANQLDETELAELTAFVCELGAPLELEAAAVDGLVQRRRWAQEAASAPGYRPAGRDSRWPTGLRYEPFEPQRWIESAETEVADGVLVLHVPGHTPGNCVVWMPRERWLFSGDQLLPEITPTPAIQGARSFAQPWRFRSLPEFVQSLRAIRELGAIRCFPGHGPPFDNVQDVIDENLSQIEQRSGKVAEAIASRGSSTAYELAHELYPRALRRRFWQIIATVQGHLDLLEDEGMIRLDEGRWRRT